MFFLFLPMRFSHFSLVFPCLFLLYSCTTTSEKNKDSVELTNPLDSAASQEFIYSIIRYAGKLPGKASHETKFDTVFNESYKAIALNHTLEYLVNDKKTNRNYFMISRIAPSIKLKRVGIGGYSETDEYGNIVRYRELFRTWKMVPETLEIKGKTLFEKMISGEDLSPYYPENSGEDEWIEFPNKDTYFDTINLRWESTLDDFIEPLYQLKGKSKEM